MLIVVFHFLVFRFIIWSDGKLSPKIDEIDASLKIQTKD